MTDSLNATTLDVVPLISSVVGSDKLYPPNKACLCLVLVRFHRKGCHLPVPIDDDEFRKAMRINAKGDAIVARRWLENEGMVDRYEVAGENFYLPNFFGIKRFLGESTAHDARA